MIKLCENCHKEPVVNDRSKYCWNCRARPSSAWVKKKNKEYYAKKKGVKK